MTIYALPHEKPARHDAAWGKEEIMEISNFEKVREFHDAFGVTRPTRPTLPPQEVIDLRIELIREEFEELKVALAAGDIVGAADAVADLLVVVYGSGDVFGMDVDRLFSEVHRSNMSKLLPDGSVLKREDGKVLKGPDYSPPDLLPILANQFDNFPSKD